MELALARVLNVLRGTAQEGLTPDSGWHAKAGLARGNVEVDSGNGAERMRPDSVSDVGKRHHTICRPTAVAFSRESLVCHLGHEED